MSVEIKDQGDSQAENTNQQVHFGVFIVPVHEELSALGKKFMLTQLYSFSCLFLQQQEKFHPPAVVF
jgi:hypothetical protein